MFRAIVAGLLVLFSIMIIIITVKFEEKKETQTVLHQQAVT